MKPWKQTTVAPWAIDPRDGLRWEGVSSLFSLGILGFLNFLLMDTSPALSMVRSEAGRLTGGDHLCTSPSLALRCLIITLTRTGRVLLPDDRQQRLASCPLPPGQLPIFPCVTPLGLSRLTSHCSLPWREAPFGTNLLKGGNQKG